MDIVWILTEDNLYRVADLECTHAIDLLAFLLEIGADGEGPLDVPALVPFLDVEAEDLDEEEWAALERADVWLEDETGLRPFCLWLGQRTGGEYTMELVFQDGTTDIAVGPVGMLFRLCSMLTDDEAVPAVYTDSGETERIVTPWSLVDVGRLCCRKVLSRR